jgi:membrane-bound serine protease (ClpP class)
MRSLGLMLAFGVAFASASFASTGSASAVSTSAGEKWVELISVDSSINPATADFIDDSIQDAARNRAAALVIQLDTPGGLLTSAQRIVKSIMGAPIPVIVYVAPSGAGAASAGTFITEAANIAAMAPGTTIGAAHPVGTGGEDVAGVMGEKIENFTASFARSIAQERGRNPDWVEDAVRKSAAIGDREALAKHVIDLVAPDVPSLLAQASGRQVTVNGATVTLDLAGAAIRPHRMSLGQQLFSVLADPNLVYLLMMAGVLGLYFEFAHPGVFLPGVIGAICLLLALASFEVLPINLAALLLIFLGVMMLASEAFVTSYGVMGLGGVTAFVLGSLFLIDRSQTDLEISRGIIAGGAAGLSAIILGVGYVITRDRRRAAQTGSGAMVGEIGEVREAIAPGAPGQLFVHGELWRAVSDEPIGAGGRARVTAVQGLEVEVRRVA